MTQGRRVVQGNDISNEVAPRLMFIIEDLLFRHEEDDAAKVQRYIRRQKWSRLIRLWSIDAMMAAHLWDIVWRSPYSFDLITVTSGDDDWIDLVEHKLDRHNVPYAGLLGFDGPDALAKHVVYMPNILRLYHARPDWGLKFGHVGELVSDAHVFQVR